MTHNPYTPPGAELEKPSNSSGHPGVFAKRSLGPRIVLAAGWFVFCGGYAIWSALRDHQWQVKVMGTIIGAAVVFAAIGVLLGWSWSRWIIYTFVAWSSGILLYLLWGSVRAGYFPLEAAQLTALSLVPGLSILCASVWSADIVRRRFRKMARTPQPRRSPRAAGFAGAALALGFFAVCAPAAEPSYSVFLGRVLRAETLDVPVGCPEDIVCAWSWVRFKIALTRQLAGPKLSRNVLAVREQHQRPRGNPNEISLFVVVPIEDPDLRKQLKASHKLVEYEPPEYCPKESLGKYGVEKSKYYEAWAHDGGCVSIE